MGTSRIWEPREEALLYRLQQEHASERLAAPVKHHNPVKHNSPIRVQSPVRMNSPIRVPAEPFEETWPILTDGQSRLEETCLYDDSEAFWTAQNYGAGSYSGALSEETTIKIKGTSSLKITVGAGLSDKVGFDHQYGSDQDWSACTHISFWWYGINSGYVISVQIWAPTSNVHMWGKNFTDNFSGWKRFVWKFNEMTVTGSPTLTQVRNIWFSWLPAAAHSMYLDRTIVDMGIRRINTPTRIV